MIPDGLTLAATTAADGNLALHTVTDEGEVREALANRERLLATLGLTLDDLVVGDQVHGATVRAVAAADRGRGARRAEEAFPETDGLAVTDPGVALMLLGADCPLLALYDPERPALAVVHAGWRGLLAGIPGEGLRALGATDPASVQVFLAPCAGPCCYEVGPEVAGRFHPDVLRPGAGDRTNLDLPAAVERALGRPVTRLADACTICDDRWFSHRRDGTRARQALVAALRPRPRNP